ncbi:MAG: protein kinase [Lentisphaeraceae bacterium]|nr:protein kinase [Lentisphaeraceae bacterium]
MTDTNRNEVMSGLFDEALSLSSDEALSQSALFNELKSCSNRYVDMTVYKTGGSKVIHEAHDKMTDRRVAVATLKENSDITQVDSFIREARLNALLQHPNIIPVYDMGVNENNPFFSMKFIAGNSLADIIRALNEKEEEFHHKYPQTVLIDIFLNICNGMSYAHSQGIMHLDLKPENIRVDKFGDVLICDWGLAALIDGHDNISDYFGSLENYSLNKVDLKNPTLDGFIKGTPGYMAPEQTGRTEFKKGPWTDTYSLGSVLYSLLCYRAPFEGEFEEVLVNTSKSKFPKPSSICCGIPSQLEAICLKAMSLTPDNRYQKVEDFHDDILAYRNGYITSAEDFTLLKFTHFFIRRNKAVSAISFVAVVLLIIFTAVFIGSLDESRDNALKLAEKYRYERNENVKRGTILSTQFLDKYNTAYRSDKFIDAMSYAESAIRLDPSRKIAYLHKAQLQCIFYQFEESLKTYKLAGQTDFLYEIAHKYRHKSKPLSIKMKLEIIEEAIRNKGRGKPGSDFVHNQIYSEMEIGDRLEFVEGILKLYNPQIELLNFHYDEQAEYLNISHNQSLDWGFALQNFPLKGVDISFTKINSFGSLRAASIQELNISHTPIKGLGGLITENLRSLNASYTQISNLRRLENSPIQILDISHTLVKDLTPLLKMKYLRNLVVHKNQFSEKKLAVIPPQIEVTIIN